MVVASVQKMRVISWNLLHGQQIPPSGDQNWSNSLQTAAQVVSQNYQPDFVAIQEVDFMQKRSGMVNQTKVIAENLHLKYWAFLPALTGTPGERWLRIKNPEQSIIRDSDTKLINESLYGIGFATNVAIKKIHIKYLGRSLIGMPLIIPKENGKGVRFIYVKDEPRVALIAELENGITIATTHLSFVPGVNIFQLVKLSTYLKKLPGTPILIGDLNLPANLPSKFSKFKSLISQATYPSWKPSIQFDYIMAQTSSNISTQALSPVKCAISDHVPIGAELTFG